MIPILKSNYGFSEIDNVAKLVDEPDCAISIGFIPWNYLRTTPKVVALFRSRWPRLSLCVHGCDHMGYEFCTETLPASWHLIELALDRMRRLNQRTALDHRKVIVFPRKKFSTLAMQALRQSKFLGAVNAELRDAETGRGVRARELLRPAISAYAGSPLFRRRPAGDPIVNLALDLLLGKPFLVGIHHDCFQNGVERFISRTLSSGGKIRAQVPLPPR